MGWKASVVEFFFFFLLISEKIASTSQRPQVAAAVPAGNLTIMEQLASRTTGDSGLCFSSRQVFTRSCLTPKDCKATGSEQSVPPGRKSGQRHRRLPAFTDASCKQAGLQLRTPTSANSGKARVPSLAKLVFQRWYFV